VIPEMDIWRDAGRRRRPTMTAGQRAGRHSLLGPHGNRGRKAVDAAVRYNARGEPENEGFAIGHCYNTAGRSFLLFALLADQ
jgi:hypothetical protein